MVKSLTMTQPDDWHVHLREGRLMQCVAPFTAMQFGRALIMPNLTPPVATARQAIKYRQSILGCLPSDTTFDPKMSIYLTDNTRVEEVIAVAESEHLLGFKLYPAGATTNSDTGVTNVSKLMPVFEKMAAYKVALQIHGEVTDTHIDLFDREAAFIEQVLQPLHQEIPDLKVVLEHITTQQGVAFVQQTDEHIGGTITPQHLMYNRNALFNGGIRPHLYCLPVLKREAHRQALVNAAVSGDRSFFLGTDSAPHTRTMKESACGCAGIFSAHAAIEFYAEIFEQAGALDRLEGFASHHGADFYGLPRNRQQITLSKEPHDLPESIAPGSPSDDNETIIPLMAGESITWKMRKPHSSPV